MKTLIENERSAVDRSSFVRSAKLKNPTFKDSSLTPGTIYLGHIPDGFEEEEIQGYFSQFGDLKRFKLARSKRTGRSKGYAFIEFECDEVARIVSETMNNYLMFEKILKCSMIQPDKVNDFMFRGYQKGERLSYQNAKLALNKMKTSLQVHKSTHRRIRTLNNSKKALRTMGINFDFKIKKNNRKKVPKQLSQKSADSTGLSTHTLEIDSSEDEVTFKTPPGVRKMFKSKPDEIISLRSFEKPIFKGSTPISQTPFGFKVFMGNSFPTPIPKKPSENKKAHQVNSKQNGFVISQFQKKMEPRLSTSHTPPFVGGSFSIRSTEKKRSMTQRSTKSGRFIATPRKNNKRKSAHF